MDFFRAMDVSSTGLIVQRYRMNIASENLANIESTRTARGGPYRRKQLVISSMGGSFPNIWKLNYWLLHRKIIII